MEEVIYDGSNLLKDGDIVCIFDFIKSEYREYKIHQAKDDQGTSSLFFAERKDKSSFLIGLNHNVFVSPTILSDVNYKTFNVLKRDKNYKNLRQIFKWHCKNELGILGNTFVKYKPGVNTKYDILKHFH